MVKVNNKAKYLRHIVSPKIVLCNIKKQKTADIAISFSG